MTFMRSDPIRPVALATLAYLLPASMFAWRNTNWEFVAYIIVVAVIGMGILMVHRRVRLSAGVLWALSLWGLLHMLGGLLPVPDSWPIAGTPVLYSLWLIPDLLKYDQVVHAFGFGVATIVCWEALRGQLRLPLPHSGVVLLCVFAGLGLGALNEIVEFAAVLLIPNTNVGGYVNTGWDLVANCVGASLAGIGILLRKV